MSRHHLVIGSGGLFGSSVRAALEERRLNVSCISGLKWNSAEAVNAAFSKTLKDFFARLGSESWSIYWCIGRATIRSGRDEAEWEGTLLQIFLNALEKNALQSQLSNGMISFASSAGGLYEATDGLPVTERSNPKPKTFYGVAKQASEQLLANWCSTRGVQVTLGRISSLYGPGQDLAKPQGLLSHLVRAAVMRQPITVFVPLSTTRNYVAARDAAALLIEHTTLQREHCRIANICSTESVSIATLLRTCELIVRRRIPTRLMANTAVSTESDSLRVTTVYRDLAAQVVRTPIQVGLHQLFDSALSRPSLN